MITKKVNKMPKTKASKRIELRVTDEFFQDLNSKIEDSGLSKADYFRHILSQGKVVVKKDYNSLATQVRKVGIITSPINNLNYSIILYGKNRCKKIITQRVV